jgi:cytochrome c-type biogenesis protein CcmH
MMSARRTLLLAALLVPAVTWGIAAEEPIADPEREQLYQQLIHEVRCLVCQNQTIGDSTAPLAADLRREIRRKVVEGSSEDDIKTFLLERYGDFVLYRPRLQSTTAVLWAAPVLLLLIGMLTLQRVLRRRSSLPSDVDADENLTDRQGPAR